jgi:hypothetical protein
VPIMASEREWKLAVSVRAAALKRENMLGASIRGK